MKQVLNEQTLHNRVKNVLSDIGCFKGTLLLQVKGRSKLYGAPLPRGTRMPTKTTNIQLGVDETSE